MKKWFMTHLKQQKTQKWSLSPTYKNNGNDNKKQFESVVLKEKLFASVSLGDKTQLTDLLKRTNVDFNDPDICGNTPLNFAV